MRNEVRRGDGGDPNAPAGFAWTRERLAAVLTALLCLAGQSVLRGPGVLASPGLWLGLAALVSMIFWPDAVANVSGGRTTRMPESFVRAVGWFLLGSGTLATSIAAVAHWL